MFEKNLKYYRLRKNMSKQDLAIAVGVTPMAISNYESGKRKPEIDIINRMAEALGIKTIDFLGRRDSGLEFEHCEFRKNTSLTKSQQEYVKESVEEYFNRFFTAVDCLGGEPLPVPPKCYMIPLVGDNQKNALSLRTKLGLPNEGPIEEIIGLLENKGIMVLEIEIDNDRFSGMNGFVNEYPYIAVNKSMRDERKRTTIIHELAHLMFNWDGKNEKEKETLATAIAGAFLIPENDLIRELGIKKTRLTKDMTIICQEYGISMYLLVKRAAQARIISSSLEKEFYIWANQEEWRKKEPNRVQYPEKPRLFKQLVFRAINEEGISIQKGAELLRLPYKEVEKYCGRVEAKT